MEYTFNRGDGAAVMTPLSVVPLDAGPAAFAADPRRERAGEMLVQLFTFLEDNAEQHPALMSVGPVLSSAVAAWRSGQSRDPYDGVRKVLQAVHAVRATDPSIPDT